MGGAVGFSENPPSGNELDGIVLVWFTPSRRSVVRRGFGVFFSCVCNVVVDMILGCASWFGELQCGEDFAVIVREREFSEEFECMQLPKARLEPLVELMWCVACVLVEFCFKCVGSFRFFPVFCGSSFIQLRPERRQNIC